MKPLPALVLQGKIESLFDYVDVTGKVKDNRPATI